MTNWESVARKLAEALAEAWNWQEDGYRQNKAGAEYVAPEEETAETVLAAYFAGDDLTLPRRS